MRRLRRSKDDRQALLEGPHLLAEALTAGISLEVVLVTAERAKERATEDLLGRVRCPIRLVAPELLLELADSDSPQGLVAVAALSRQGVEAVPMIPGGVYLYLDGMQDPGNLGAVARAAEASGVVACLVLGPGTVHPNHPRALRASAGSLLRLPLALRVSADSLDERLATLEPAWVALAPGGGESLWSAGLDGTLIVALGAEGPGLSPAVLARAHQRLSIPVAPPVESLNATVAAALVLYELRRRRVEA
jgi:TrmH family RNA methyltransferase